MPPRRRSKATVKVELPEPLWAKIASQLSMKDWAMVSGTCKTTFNLQPRTIDVLSSTPTAGVIWASKRLGNVEVLHLRPNGAFGLADTGVQDSNTLMSLKQLEILAPSTGDIATTFTLWFVWLLSRSQKLNLLSAVVGHLDWFPPMMQLKHLVLRCNWSVGNIFPALKYAKSLQTLSLQAGFLSTEATVMNAPCLALESLPNLRALALSRICPGHMHLPKQCRLHLAGLATLDILEDENWESASANLRSLEFACRRLFLTRLSDVFDNFQDLRNLCIIALEFLSCGDPDAPVSLADLAHVQHLSISVFNALYVSVPAKVSWQKLDLCGLQNMEITIEDISAFAGTGMNCRLASRNFSGACIFQLCLALGERGISCTTSRDGRGATTLAYPAGAARDVSGCFCGACMKCLRASGVAEMCSSVPVEREVYLSGGESSDEYEDQDEEEEEDLE